jgi:hypothetical protein
MAWLVNWSALDQMVLNARPCLRLVLILVACMAVTPLTSLTHMYVSYMLWL